MKVEQRRWFGLIFISLAVAMVIVDITIVNVAIPPIIGDLGISSTAAQWVQTAYTLTFAAFLLPWGRVADRVGRRRLLIVGVIVFAVASVLAALAPTGGLLIGARIIQGIGGAMIFPCTLSLVNANFQGTDRGKAFAVWGSTIGGVAALGPLLGGYLTTELSWRWAFWINVPIGVVVVVGVLALVDESRDPTTERGVDVVGAALSAAAAALVVFGLVEGREYGWWALTSDLAMGGVRWSVAISPVPVAFGLAVLSGVGFALWERRRARTGRVALLDLTLLRVTSFVRGNVVLFIVSLGEFGILFVLPLWIQNTLGYSAFDTGLILLPLALGSFVAGGAAAALAGRLGPLSIVRAGLVLEILGVGGLGLTVPLENAWSLLPCLAVYGFGVGLATAQLPGLVLADVAVTKSGQASGTQSTVQEIGSALGIAILGTVLFAALGNTLGDRLTDTGLPAAQRDGVVSAVKDSAGAAISGLTNTPGGEVLANAARESFSTSTSIAAYVAAGFLVLGLLASLSLRTRRYDDSGSGGGDPR